MAIPSLGLESPHVAASYLEAHDRLLNTYGRRLTLGSIKARRTTIRRGILDLARRRSPALHPQPGIPVYRGLKILM